MTPAEGAEKVFLKYRRWDRIQRQRRWQRRRQTLVVTLGLTTFLAFELFTWVIVPFLDEQLEGLETWRPPTTVRVLDSTDTLADQFSLVRRVWVPLDELPESLIQAVVVAEDRRYFQHLGIDLMGILRAASRNLWAGEWREGGSTITQQVVKNVIVGNTRSLRRKAEEALLALRLENRMSKLRILELYLNLIYLGSGNYGIEAAAQDYFGHSARKLNVAEAALLAGLIPSPSRFTPRRYPDRALERRNLVLDAMLAEGLIGSEERNEAHARPIVIPPRGPRRPDGAEGFLTEVRRQVRDHLGERIPFEAGLQVYTSLDRNLQRISETALRTALEAVEARQGRRLIDPSRPHACPLGQVRRDRRSVEIDGEVIVIEPPQQEAKVFVPVEGGSSVANAPTSFSRPLRRHIRPGDPLRVCINDSGEATPVWLSKVEGAAVVMAHETGRILALVGGRKMPMEGFNRATQAARQAGSAFKPLVYATAYDLGQSQVHVILDGPLVLNAGGHRLWIPQNASRGFWGPIALRIAFTYSLNTPAVRLAMTHGTAPIIERARGAGIESALRHDLTLALGTSEIHPVELAAAIAGIVRGGEAIAPTVIDRLVDVRGKELARPGDPIDWPGVEAELAGGEGPRFIKASSAWQVVDGMREVVRKGTGKAAFAEGRFRGGKTGTSSDYRDAWFVGFDGAYIIAVWVGQDDGASLGYGESGDRAALPAWKTIADALPVTDGPSAPPDTLPIPFGDTWVEVAADTVPERRLRFAIPAEPLPLPAAPAPPTVCRD